jgi:hypothetical protein
MESKEQCSGVESELPNIIYINLKLQSSPGYFSLSKTNF